MTAGYLVVDLGAVVFHFDHAHRLDRLAQTCDLASEQIHALLWLSGFSADCDQGRYGSAAQVRAQIRTALAFPAAMTTSTTRGAVRSNRTRPSSTCSTGIVATAYSLFLPTTDRWRRRR